MSFQTVITDTVRLLTLAPAAAFRRVTDIHPTTDTGVVPPVDLGFADFDGEPFADFDGTPLEDFA